jgi:hypothetical protein
LLARAKNSRAGRARGARRARKAPKRYKLNSNSVYKCAATSRFTVAEEIFQAHVLFPDARASSAPVPDRRERAAGALGGLLRVLRRAPPLP